MTQDATLAEEKKQLLDLISREAYFQKKITLSSGKESDYYIDARLITLQPLGAYLCARQMLDLIGNTPVDAIGGPTLGADPLIGAIGVVSLQQQRPVKNFIIRKEAKAHGMGKQIEGPVLSSGERVVVIDDVATTGKAFVHSLDVLQAMGIEVVKCICVVDREEGAREAVEAKGSELAAIFKASDIHKPSG
ncbi:MAG: orotate phosphoribosyltransferase [Candidatus Omnitrophica bacterium]|nr:orotate phosphoribosyltransferase [Candidatus Omnitrophota bacterium]